MRSLFSFVFLLVIVCLSNAQTNTELSISLIGKMQRAQYDSCQIMFDTLVSNQLNADMLKNIWESIPKYVGDYKSFESIETEKNDSVEIISVRCVFVKTKLDLELSYNKQQKIVRIFFVPPKNNLAYNFPRYYKSYKFYESKLSLKSGKYELPAVLNVPNNLISPPVVILLAGSGPNDKDETIGPNKPLKDIALGLAANGIASLRYDKRTLVYKNEMAKNINELGINAEVIEDAVNAINSIKKNPQFKKSKIYIIGHSLGAMCAPLVASKTKVNGIVMMAGNARPLQDLVLEQYTYIFSLDSLSDDEKKVIAELKSQTAILKNAEELKKATPDKLPLGLPSAYWQSLNAYDQVATAKKLKCRLLVLQGERDYQVTMKDFNIWKDNLKADEKNTFISYPTLNHLFISGEGKSVPSEYENPGNINEKVISDIVKWISGN